MPSSTAPHAENPDKGFLPSPVRITGYREPELAGGRINSGVAEGWAVSPCCDPLLAKLVSHGSTRAQAIARMTTILFSMVLDGLVHNGALHRVVLESAAFLGGDVHTGWLEGWYRTACEAGKT